MHSYPRAAVERMMNVQEVILRAMAKKITWWQAAEIIGMSDRQMRRLHWRYREHGYDGQLDALRSLRQQVRGDLLAESGKHGATNLLRQIPSIGPIRAALLIALLQTPHRFCTKRQLWAYSGLALKTSASGEYRFVEGQLGRSRNPLVFPFRDCDESA